MTAALTTADDIRRRARMAIIIRAAGRKTTDVNPSARSVSVEKAAWWSQRLGVPVPPGTPTAALPSSSQIDDVLSLSPEQRAGYLKLRAAGGTHARVMRDLRGLPARKSTGAKATKATPVKADVRALAEGLGIDDETVSSVQADIEAGRSLREIAAELENVHGSGNEADLREFARRIRARTGAKATGTKATKAPAKKAPAKKGTGSLAEGIQQAQERDTRRELADRETAKRETARQIEQRRTPAKKAPAKKASPLRDALREQGERDARRESADREARTRATGEALSQSHTREAGEERRAPAKKATAPRQTATSKARVARVAGAFHEDWRRTRRRDDGSFEPRVKKTKDQAWIDAHGTDEVDIANTSYEDLPEDWQRENREAAAVVEGILARRGGSVDLSDEKTRQEVGEEIHQAWLSRNDWARGGDLDKPFSELPADEQAKDVDQVAVAMRVLPPAKKATSREVDHMGRPLGSIAPVPDGMDPEQWAALQLAARTPAKATPAKATGPRVTPTERRRQQRVEALDRAIAAAESNDQLSRVQVGGARSAVDSLRRMRDGMAEGRTGDEAFEQDLNNIFVAYAPTGEARQIMRDLSDEHKRLVGEHRLPEPRATQAKATPAKATPRPAKAATPRKAAPAKKATPRATAAPSASVADHVAALDAMETRDQAYEYLANVKGQELRDLARRYSAQGGVGGSTAQGMRDGIVDATVGARLDSAAILQGATLPYGDRPSTDLPAYREAEGLPTSDRVTFAAAAGNLTGADRAAFLAWLRDNPGGSLTAWQAQRQERRPAATRRLRDMTRLSDEALAAAREQAPEVGYSTDPAAISQALARFNAADLLRIADAFNITIPSTARTVEERRGTIAFNAAQANRRRRGGI